MGDVIPDLQQWHAALIFIIIAVFGVINAVVMRSKAQAHISEQPHLASGYEKLFKGTILVATIPFGIILLGILLGQVSIPSTFFELTNPWMIAFLGIILLFDLWATKTVFFGQGADFLAKHDAGFGRKLSPALVKLLTSFMLLAHLGFIVGLILLPQLI